MSYSRWSGADWYIFWHCGETKTRAGQLLSVWSCKANEIPTYTYTEIKNIIDNDLYHTIPGYDKDSMNPHPWVCGGDESNFNASIPDMPDKRFLREIFEHWMGEVEEEYK